MITPSPNPPLFCADTVILYSVPGNSPVTVAMVTLAVVWITLLSSVVWFTCTVYPRIAPFVTMGGAHLTDTVVLVVEVTFRAVTSPVVSGCMV